MSPGQAFRRGGDRPGDHHAENTHTENRPDAEKQHVDQADPGRLETRRQVDGQGRRAGRPVREAYEKGTPAWQRMMMLVGARGVRNLLMPVAVGMEVNLSARVAVDVDMHPIPPQAESR